MATKTGAPALECITGGASGADEEFAKCSLHANAAVTIWSFPGHSSNHPPECAVEHLLPRHFETVDRKLAIAAGRLGRRVSSKPYIRNLIRRNCPITGHCKTLYAIGGFEPRTEKRHPLSVGVKGGTGWTCQMFADRMYSNMRDLEGGQELPMYLYSQDVKQWYRCTVCKTLLGIKYEWRSCTPPTPAGSFAGIGTRHLTSDGRNAIRKLFEQLN